MKEDLKEIKMLLQKIMNLLEVILEKENLK